MSDEEIVGREIALERVYPEDLQSHFVSSIVVQHQPDVFILSFFEVWPPPILGESDEEKRRAIEAIDHVEAKCVARLAVTPRKMQEFMETMEENLHSHEEVIQTQSEWDQG